MSVSPSSIRQQIHRLYQALSAAEERDQLLSIGIESGTLTPEEQAMIGGDASQLTSEQQYRIWAWIHRWETQHKRNLDIDRFQLEARSED